MSHRRSLSIALVVALGVSLSACSGLSLVEKRSRGYELNEDAIKQIRPGQSASLVTAVLGSPQATNTFSTGNAWYYIGEKISQTAFGMELSKERTVLAVYFDKNNKVTSTERLGIKDGKVFNVDTNRTPSFGQDRTFIESILSSI